MYKDMLPPRQVRPIMDFYREDVAAAERAERDRRLARLQRRRRKWASGTHRRRRPKRSQDTGNINNNNKINLLADVCARLLSELLQV